MAMPYTKDVHETAQQVEKQKGNMGDMPPAPSRTEHELTEKITFGRKPGQLDSLQQNMATAYFTEEEVAAVRKLTDAYYRTRHIEEKYGINLSGLKKEHKRRMNAIVQTSKSRNGFASKNMKTQRIRSSENVNEFREDKIDQAENKSALDKLKAKLTGQRSKELAGSAFMEGDQLSLEGSHTMQNGRRKTEGRTGAKW